MSSITLITGGARSGKSSHALSLAREYPLPRAFIATAEPFDDDMRRRIERHRAERAEDFDTHESPLDLAATLKELHRKVHVAVVDCLTVWLGNLLHHYPDTPESQEQIDRLLLTLDHPPCELIVVTNEVGMGIVPHNDLARQFRDLAGTLNQQVAAKDGVTLLGTGEMGIGNTTPSAALFAALLPCEVETVTGPGTGIDRDRLIHKQTVIRRALEVNRARLSDPLGALAAVGGFEIAGICGLILGAATRRIPMVVDGFISTAGALVAWKLCPAVRDYLFFSHVSAETGHRMFFDRMGVRPLLDLDMRLGEGTGAALGMCVIEAAVKVYRKMATFDSADVARKDSSE